MYSEEQYCKAFEAKIQIILFDTLDQNNPTDISSFKLYIHHALPSLFIRKKRTLYIAYTA